MINHERIHLRQWEECLLLLFPFIYLGLYLYRRVIKREFHTKAYHLNPMEREAYRHQADMGYNLKRVPYEWVRILRQG